MKSYKSLLNIILSCGVITSFWVFARFTVDDAFISWRYGKNLVETGIWNYNPSYFDLTQAYTNPIYAILSIVPNFLGIDVVLFFKIISLLTIVVFTAWFYRKTKASSMLLLFYATPVTIVHAFSGLETFLFIVLLTVLLISLYEEKVVASTFIAFLLILTRPESWLLVALVPFYFLLKPIEDLESTVSLKLKKVYETIYKLNWKIFSYSFFSLALVLGIYFIIHITYFGNGLPNTFYIKSSSLGISTVIEVVKFGILLLPLLLFLSGKKFRLFAFSILFFGALVLSYSTSNLMMNYMNRFQFHIVAPIYLFLIYLSQIEVNSFYIADDLNFKNHIKVTYSVVINIVATVYLVLFLLFTVTPHSAAWATGHYPRILNAQAELGKTLNKISDKYNIKSFSFGDAGAAAYHSELKALDNIGLGSSKLAHNGMSFNLLNEYGIDIAIFYARPHMGIRLNDHNQRKIYKWVKKNEFIELCDIYWKERDPLKVFAKKNIPEIVEVCNNSKQQNEVTEENFVLDTLPYSPFHFWHE
ncbi:MAG: hypothetical protein ACQETL_17425 [Bacteroidota bacterium]